MRKGRIYVVSWHIGKENIPLEAPAAKRVNSEIEALLNWINEEHSMDLVVKAAVAHLSLLTIHLFDDGNGCIGRAIADLLLA